MALTGLYVDEPDISSKGVTRCPTIVATCIAMPESSSGKLSFYGFAVFIQFYLTH